MVESRNTNKLMSPVPQSSTDIAGKPAHVIKRDGARQPFNEKKILSAIERAGRASGNEPPAIEQIQDVVERTLIAAGFIKTARAYIAYREQHRQQRQDRRTLIDVALSVNEYLDQQDWRVHANANQGYSLGGLILNVSGKVIANYWLNHVYPPEVGEAHREGDIHIHDLDMLAGYCAGWSLRQFLHEGLNGVPGKVEAAAPKHMSSAVGQIVNFLGTLQNEWAGAQAFSS